MTQITKEQLEQSDRLARSATPGPWKGDEYEITAPYESTLFPGNVKLVLAEDYHLSEENGRFVIHHNPDYILKLNADYRALLERVNSLEYSIEKLTKRLEERGK